MELSDRMKELGVTPEQLARWQAEPEEGFVGAGLGTLRDIAAYAERCTALRSAQNAVIEPGHDDLRKNEEESALRQTRTN